ncbi:MAG: soluble lytic murein transglycosylase-like protein, partial [Myxococcota bacterium]
MLVMLLAQAALAWSPALADAVATGDCTSVLAAPIDGPEARLAHGHCLVRIGKTAAAVDVLAPLTEGVLGDYARARRAQALLAEKRPAEAAAALDGLDLPGPGGLDITLIQAQAKAASGDYDGAKSLFNALLGTRLSGEARLALAEAAAGVGRVEPAIGVWRSAWSSDVAGDADDRAAEALGARGRPVTDLSDAATLAAAKERVAALKSAHQHGEARELMLGIQEVESGTYGPVTLAFAAFRGRDYADSSERFEAALGAPASASGSAKALYHYALGLSRTGDYAAAATVYRRLTAQHPSDKLGDEGSYKLGYLEYDAGNLAEAVELFAAHLQAYPSSEFLESTLWFRARALWLLGRKDDAVSGWQRLARERPGSSLTPGAAYWIARATDDDDALARIVDRYPTSGYAWLAADRVGRTFPAKPLAAAPPWPDALASRSEVRRSAALAAVGLRAEAAAELSPVRSAAKSAGRDGALAAAHALLAVGDYRGAKSLAAPYCTSPWKGGDPVAQQVCTPRPESAIVGAVAAKYGLDPLVPYGIMTAESALDPSVTSIAGARGLMQLMPVEAGRVHAELYERPYDAIDLYSAPYNASLGTAELGGKARSLDGVLVGPSLPAAIAAYNGGETAVRRWLDGFDIP